MEYLPLIALVIVFYLLVLRPVKARQREALAMQSSLAAGQDVVTASGIYGSVVSVEDDSLVLEIAPGVQTRWATGAIARILPTESDQKALDVPDSAAGLTERQPAGETVVLPDAKQAKR